MRKLFRQKHKIKAAFNVWLLMFSLFLIASSSFIKPVGSQDWWDDRWAFRKIITINYNTAEPLQDFPILIEITDRDLKEKAQFDGEDIVFIGNNGILSFEIEQYDSSTGHLVAWVRVPTLQNGTLLYMYYGNPEIAQSMQNVTNVWDSNYVMVQHLEEQDIERIDSTRNWNNGTAYGDVKKTTGRADGADLLDGNGDYITISDSSSLKITSQLTVEAWFCSASGLGGEDLGWYGGLGKAYAYELGWQGWTDGWTFQIYVNGARIWLDTKNVYMPKSRWSYVVGQYNGTHLKIFVNSTLVGLKEIGVVSIDVNENPFQIGLCRGGSWNGTIDEVRISNISRSEAWIKACYDNQKDPASFIKLSNEEVNPDLETPIVLNVQPEDQAIETYTNPELSAYIYKRPDEGNLTILFQEKISNIWQTIRIINNAANGRYSAIPSKMNKLGTTYYWRICIYNGTYWTNKTFSFTTTTKVLQQKWLAKNLPRSASGVLISDINNDGAGEIFHAGKGGVVALNGTNGHIIWYYSDDRVGFMAQAQMADLTKDGIPEIVVPLEKPAGLLVLHANNGSFYWDISGLGLETYSSPVIADINGDGYPTIFMASTDIYKGLNGTGRISAISHNGTLLYQTFAWRPCGGGLSIADADGDGEFELYMGDRHMYLNHPEHGDNDYGKGVQSFWAKNLTLRWYHPDILCSSNIPILADVNGDGILEVIIGDLDGGLAVLNSTDGSAIRKIKGRTDRVPVHYQPSVYDIDQDGHLEMLMADAHDETSDDLVVWDLVDWKEDARIYIGKCYYGPQVADVTGDGIMEIIACNYRSIIIIDKNYQIIGGITGLSGDILISGQPQFIDGIVNIAGVLNYAVAQDIDGDNYTELVVSTQSGYIYALDTPARIPKPRPRTEIQFYSEYRLGAAEYVPPPGRPQPVITSVNPPNNAENVPLSLAKLEFTVIDYQSQTMNYSVTTSPDIGSQNGTIAGKGRVTLNITKKLVPSTTYTWTVSVTDGTHWTNKTFTFTTEPLMPWWDKNWKYRKKIIIDHTKVSGYLQNFPLLITFANDSDIALHAQQDGDDIVFVDANNNKLHHEIEFFNSTTGTLVAWVNVPHLSPENQTTIYLYYGNPVAENQEEPTLVWDQNFAMVQHLEETANIRNDSTPNDNDGLAQGNIQKAMNGKIDGADELDGVDDFINVLNSATLNITSEITVEAWFCSASGLGGEDLGWYGGLGKAYAYELGWQGWTDGWTFQIYVNGARIWLDTKNVYMQSNEWHYIVGVYDGTYLKLYFDGELITTKEIGSVNIDSNNRPFQIGISRNNSHWNGTIDEVRISNIARSPAWIETCYNNQKNPREFYKIGKQEEIPKAPVIYAPSPPNKAENIPLNLTRLSFNITDYQGDQFNYTVTAEPNIIEGIYYGINVSSGRYAVNITGLEYSKTYKWTVTVTDGNSSSTITFHFTTKPSEPPTQSDPVLIIDENGNIVCYNQTTTDPNGDKVTNIYVWYRNGTTITNLLLPFETNSSTKVKDYSGYNNDGKIIGQVIWTSKGIVGGAYQFERGFIQIPGSNKLDGGGTWSEITIECWVNIKEYQSGTRRIIARIPSYEIGISQNKLFASIWTATGDPKISGLNKITSNITLSTGTWNHIVLSYKKGEALTLYVNGTIAAYLNATQSQTLNYNIQPSGSNPLYIGWFDYFKGSIDEIRVYPKCLSPQQIVQRFKETRNGLSNSSTIVKEEVNPGEIWKCEVTPNDSHLDGTTKSSNTVTIGYNNKPVAKDLKITPQTPKTDDNLTGSYTFFDPDGDPENTTLTEIRWYRDGVLVPELNNTLVVPYNFTTKGEEWFFTVRPSDGKEYGGIYESPHVLIQNSPPEIVYYSPINTTIEINETEAIEFAHVSLDLDNDTLTFLWLLDGIEQSTAQNWTYTTDYTSAGTHNITLVVYDTDLATDSQQWTVIVLNVNRPPEALNLTITPENPTTKDNLVANYTYYDPDEDPENGTEILWYKDGQLQPHLNNTLVVPANQTSKGETWYFTVKPKDGKDFGELRQSPNVTIQNTPPQITYIKIIPGPAYTNDTLTINITAYDADGDNITYTYQWQIYQNDTWQDIPEATNDTLKPEKLPKGRPN